MSYKMSQEDHDAQLEDRHKLRAKLTADDIHELEYADMRRLAYKRVIHVRQSDTTQERKT